MLQRSFENAIRRREMHVASCVCGETEGGGVVWATLPAIMETMCR
jgi:hypothetical protein